MERLTHLMVRHPDLLVMATAAMVLLALANYGRAVEVRTLLRTGNARAASEALGG